MRPLALALVCGTLVWSGAVSAAEIDLSTWTCRKFQSASKDDVGVILAWLDGYYKGENGRPIIDTDKFVQNGAPHTPAAPVRPNYCLCASRMPFKDDQTSSVCSSANSARS